MVTNLSNIELTADGSDTPRLLKDRFAEVVNVKDFGAKGDGVTDDSTAINAAITHAKTFWEDRDFGFETSTPCMLYFPPGIYWCNNTQFDLKLVLETDQTYPERYSSSMKDSTHVTVMGASHQVSVLFGGGLTFNSARIDVRNLGFWGRDYPSGSGTAMTGGLTAIEYRGGRYDFYNNDYFGGVVGGSGASGNIENINIRDYDKGIWLRNLNNRTRVTRVNIQGGNVGFFIDSCVGPTLSECDTNQAQQVGFRLYGKLGEVRMSQCRANGGFRNMEILPVRYTDQSFAGSVLESYFENVSLSGAGGWITYKNARGIYTEYTDPNGYTYDSTKGRNELLIPIQSITKLESGAKMRITFAEAHRLRETQTFAKVALGTDLTEDHDGWDLYGNFTVIDTTTIEWTLGDDNTVANWDVWEGATIPSSGSANPYYLLLPGWDLYIDGTGSRDGYADMARAVYDLWFTQCNINVSYLHNCEHIRFNHSRLKEIFYLDVNEDGTPLHDMITFFGNRKGRSAGDVDILPHGPGAKKGWCSFEVSRVIDDANTGGVDLDQQPVLKMEIPYRANNGSYGTTQADGVPTKFSGIHVHRNKISMHGLPTSDLGLVAGDLYIQSGTLKIKE